MDEAFFASSILRFTCYGAARSPCHRTIRMDSYLLQWVFGCLAAYLLGSIPFGFLIARAKGVDIRTVGSGNIGATNVFRCVSKPLGILTFLLDMAKGFAGCTVVPYLAARWMGGATGDLPFRVVCGFLAVAGHNWTVFLGFRGGKGVATSAGLLLGLTPAGCGIALAIWAAVFLTTRYVSLASIAAAAALGVAAWLPFCRQGSGWWFPAMLDVLAVLAIWRHRSNIRRLREGTESRFQFKKRS
jgi:glycerol-3-phosphate acyltransferase PlsY